LDRAQTLELLRQTHSFPGPHTFKVIGRANNDFVRRVLVAIRAIAVVDADNYSTRSTPGGRHVAVTVEPIIHSAEQVLDVYDRIKVVDGVVMTM
jgi:putative lipoic acid-binding regulatory protein